MMRGHTRNRRRGFTPTQLLLLLALFVFLFGFLFAALFRVRQAADRAESQNNLKQITLATIKTADDYDGKMPPGAEGYYPAQGVAEGNGYGPCLFHILPNLEQKPLHDSTSLKVGDVSIRAAWMATGTAIRTYSTKSDPTADPATDRTSYLANELSMPEKMTRYPASFSDGTSNTILYAEGYAQTRDTVTFGAKSQTWMGERRWWESPVWSPVPGPVMFQVAPLAHAASARFPQGFVAGGIQVALGDGSVRVVNDRVSSTTFYHACTPNGGEVLGNDW